MGGLRKLMPVTFATYAVGMMALSGVPLFAGFWSKDDILHSAHTWPWSQIPYALGVIAALLTAFYMMRQVCYVFFGPSRWAGEMETPQESPGVMTIPLTILAVFAVGLGFIGTPAWPWLQNYLEGQSSAFNFRELTQSSIVTVLLTSSVIALAGIVVGWWLYGRQEVNDPEQPDALEKFQPDIFFLLQNKYFVDEFYEATVIRFNAWFAQFCDDVDYWFWNGGVLAIGYVIIGLSWVSRVFDEYVIDLGFYETCRGVAGSGRFLSSLQNGRVQNYLRVIGVALAALGLFLLWGCQAP
jgi:NADH-quinone oxidoreductase subunit L